MRWHFGRFLFWVAIGLVTSSFVLALVGEETASTSAKQALLLWHEWIGLCSLAVLIVSFAVNALDVHRPRRLLSNWLPRFRAVVDVSFYALLVVQPISGWLLASHEGKLASFFGWTLPSLANPSNVFADIGYIYHGVGGALIVLIAILSLRLNLTAWIFSLWRYSKRGHRATLHARRPKSPRVR